MDLPDTMTMSRSAVSPAAATADPARWKDELRWMRSCAGRAREDEQAAPHIRNIICT